VASKLTFQDKQARSYHEEGSKQKDVYCLFHANLWLDLLYGPEDKIRSSEASLDLQQAAKH
jgi:hypothetical protein